MASFEQKLSALIGLECWAVFAGQGSGSMATLDLGRRIKQLRPIPNRGVPPGWRHFMGEYCVFIEGCSWRLDDRSTIFCGWGEDEVVIKRKMRRLVGCKVTAAELCNSAFDLLLSFDNRYMVRLFCDQTAIDETLDNYSIRTPDGWYCVGPRSKLRFEPTNTR
jgi:hypothetical protein